MLCLGFEPAAEGLLVQTGPLSYVGSTLGVHILHQH